MKRFSVVALITALVALTVLFAGRSVVFADEWTEYVGPALPEYDVAPTPPPPSGLPEVQVFAGPRTNASGIEVITVLVNPPLLPLPAWADPILSSLSIDHAGQNVTIEVNDLLDVPYWLERSDIPDCSSDRYCYVQLRAHALVPNGDGRYELLDSVRIAVMLPPLPL